jgi:hypothetical protein
MDEFLNIDIDNIGHIDYFYTNDHEKNKVAFMSVKDNYEREIKSINNFIYVAAEEWIALFDIIRKDSSLDAAVLPFVISNFIYFQHRFKSDDPAISGIIDAHNLLQLEGVYNSQYVFKGYEQSSDKEAYIAAIILATKASMMYYLKNDNWVFNYKAQVRIKSISQFFNAYPNKKWKMVGNYMVSEDKNPVIVSAKSDPLESESFALWFKNNKQYNQDFAIHTATTKKWHWTRYKIPTLLYIDTQQMKEKQSKDLDFLPEDKRDIIYKYQGEEPFIKFADGSVYLRASMIYIPDPVSSYLGDNLL